MIEFIKIILLLILEELWIINSMNGQILFLIPGSLYQNFLFRLKVNHSRSETLKLFLSKILGGPVSKSLLNFKIIFGLHTYNFIFSHKDTGARAPLGPLLGPSLSGRPVSKSTDVSFRVYAFLIALNKSWESMDLLFRKACVQVNCPVVQGLCLSNGP